MLMEASGADFGGKETPELFVAWVGDEALSYSLGLVYSLRKQGVRVIIDTKARNLKGQLKYANKLGAAYTVVIGEDEISTGELTLKNMNTSEQTKTAREDLIKTIRG